MSTATKVNILATYLSQFVMWLIHMKCLDPVIMEKFLIDFLINLNASVEENTLSVSWKSYKNLNILKFYIFSEILATDVH